MYLFSFLFIINIIFADYGGGYAGSGFRYGSNAREFSLAGAVVADKTPGFYAFSNPALFHFSRDNHVGFSYQAMSLDRSIMSFSFSRRLPPSGGLGLAYFRSGTDNIIIFRCDLLRYLGIHLFLALRSVARTWRKKHDAGRGRSY